jgi:hypothetical protein
MTKATTEKDSQALPIFCTRPKSMPVTTLTLLLGPRIRNARPCCASLHFKCCRAKCAVQ